MSGVVQPVVARLAASKGLTGALAVEGMAGFQQALRGVSTSPIQFVLPTGDSASRSSSATMITRQDGEERFDVVTAFLLATLAKAVDTLDAVRDATRQTLLGWPHPLSGEPVEYRGGRLMIFDPAKGQLFWQQSFAFQRLFEG